MKHRICLVLWFLLLFSAYAGAEEFDAAMVFTSRCGACHTVGQGDDVGPDLQGVSERRDPAWLVAFVQSSQSVIRAGDPTALELFERYGRQKMPDHPYTAEQIGEILAFIDAGGPASASTIRLAETATPEEVRAGRDHFFGRSSGQRASCGSCHTANSGRMASLYLGGSLADVFSKYGDRELARALARDKGICRRALEPEKSFIVRAYLRDLDARDGEEASAQLLARLGNFLGSTVQMLLPEPTPGDSP